MELNKPLQVGILTVSDRSHQGLRPDAGGPALQSIALERGWTVAAMKIVPDDQNAITDTLLTWTDHDGLDVILTTGGTGIGPRDVTPEATQRVLEKNLPGLPELMRSEGLKKTPFAVLSRAVAGVRGATVIVNFPGNPSGARESLLLIAALLEHTHHMLRGQDHPVSTPVTRDDSQQGALV